MKSAIGFAKYQYILTDLGIAIDLMTIVTFSIIGIAGCAIGTALNKRLNQKTLKKVFAVFLVLIGAFVIFRECQGLFKQPDANHKTEQIELPTSTNSNQSKSLEGKS